MAPQVLGQVSSCLEGRLSWDSWLISPQATKFPLLVLRPHLTNCSLAIKYLLRSSPVLSPGQDTHESPYASVLSINRSLEFPMHPHQRPRKGLRMFFSRT